ncbi:MAG: hypothetical protein GX664_04040 [Bacteroidales bacterium]|nr:hypothetical protein [Bacteroidales bacterium]
MIFGFYNGMKVQVIDSDLQDSNFDTIVKVVEDYRFEEQIRPGTEYLINKGHLQPLVYDVFSIGDRVRSDIGTLTGRIVAFEYHTNRAIVVSDRIDNYKDKRTRYAYAVHEIEKYDPGKFTFVPGRWYRINSYMDVMVIESAFRDTDVMLINREGKIVIHDVPKEASSKLLMSKFGIARIDILSR